jgi:H+/Cl- antiporter ClcA
VQEVYLLPHLLQVHVLEDLLETYSISQVGNANLLMLSGMVAFLTGVTRTPFTAAILVLEMTDRHSIIFYLMLAALVANLVSLIVDRRSFTIILKSNT